MSDANSKIVKKRCSLACVSCRTKKVKCNIKDQFPCISCCKSGSKCIKSVNDKRKKQSETEYVKSLLKRLKMYEEENSRISGQLTDIANVMKDISKLNETFISKNEDKNLRQINIDSDDITENDRDKVITTETGNQLSTSKPDENQTGLYKFTKLSKLVDFHEKYPTPSSFKTFENKPVSVYGPTSVFDSVSILNLKNNQEVEEIDQINRDPLIIECIKLFFKWQYPDIHIFIFRETFLLDFFHAKPNSSYCSKELIFAICSVGSLLSSDLGIKNKSLEFYEKSRVLCFQNYDKPSIALLQSFLLLGLYDIYNGKNDSGWILSGIAMRIGYNIGFQLNPKSWFLEKTTDTRNEFNTKIRSRIFWGTFIVDHLIGLLLGRPSSLKKNDTTIQETIELPNIDWIDEYSFQSNDLKRPEILKIGDPLRSIVNLMDITESMLNEIFNDNKNRKNASKINLSKKLVLLEKYNLKISQWRKNLSRTETWNTCDLDNIGSDPTKLTFKLLYYIVVLCLNRPFLNVGTEENQKSSVTNSSIICANAIDDLTIAIRRFVKSYGFSRCSILIIYSCVISISVVLLFNGNNIKEILEGTGVTRFRILLFTLTLKECSSIWGLSDKSYKMIKAKLIQDYEVDIEEKLRNFDIFDDFEPFPHSQLAASNNSKDTFLNWPNSNNDIINAFDNQQSSDESLEHANNLENKGDSFGGPPIFMTSTIYSAWEHLFPDYNFDNFNYENNYSSDK